MPTSRRALRTAAEIRNDNVLFAPSKLTQMIVTMTPDARHAGGECRHGLQALQNGSTLGHELVCLGTQRLGKHVGLRREHLQDLIGVAAQVSRECAQLSSGE